jgi:hypothetical protein
MIDQSYSGQHSTISGPAQDGDDYAQRFKVIDNVAGSSRVLGVPENTHIDVAAPLLASQVIDLVQEPLLE